MRIIHWLSIPRLLILFLLYYFFLRPILFSLYAWVWSTYAWMRPGG